MHEKAKEAAAKKAVEFIKPNMIVGLGSGSTAEKFIHELCIAYKNGLKIKAVSSSRNSANLAEQGGVKTLDINEIPYIDITVDGADEIDKEKRMIKGGGGAHVREKILASSSKEMIVIVDESKLVKTVGKGKLPIEVLFYGSPATRSKIEALGYQGKWRMQEDGTLFITENGNLLFDMHFQNPPESPEILHQEILNIPGVIDTGFFFDLASKVIVGYEDGTSKVFDHF